jgi:hypothetical protein
MELIQIALWGSIIINLVFIYGIRNLIKQNEELEDRVINTIYNTQNRVQTALDSMRDIDNREVFEKDDEVGSTFEELKNIIEELNNEI